MGLLSFSADGLVATGDPAFDIDRHHCPNSGAGELKIISAIPEGPVIQKLLEHLMGYISVNPEIKAATAT